MSLLSSSHAPQLSRRRFGQILLLSAISCLTSQSILPMAASATNLKDQNEQEQVEKYHIYVSRELAEQGGNHFVTFRSGLKKAVSIPPNSSDGNSITVKTAALDGKDAVIQLHTLYESAFDVKSYVEAAIADAPIMRPTKERCIDVYTQLESRAHIADSDALNMLDIIVSGDPKLAKADEGQIVQRRYQIASQNSRLIVLQACIEDKIVAANLSSEEEQKLRGIFQFVRAGEALPSQNDLEDLTTIDAMVQDSSLTLTLKQLYTIASAQTRAYTVDEIVLDLIQHNPYIADKRDQFLATYNEARLGQKVQDDYILGSLDSLVYMSDIAPECKAIYKLSRDRFYEQDDVIIGDILSDYFKQAKLVRKNGSDLVPTVIRILSATGVTASTGTAIGSLSGAAVTNATLAAIGGGSVAAGGLGMLGGLAIVTGGAALVGAAAIASLIKVGGMSNADKQRLGISTAAGSLTSAALVGSAWAAVSTFSAAGSLTGAAAISSSIAALGGVSMITGGAALLAFGVSLGVWHFLEKQKDVKLTIQQLEPWLYTWGTGNIITTPIVKALQDYLSVSDSPNRVHLVPDIPFEKLANALKHYVSVAPDEKILALVDTSIFNDSKEGITFTNKGIWWKHLFDSHYVAYSDPEYLIKVIGLPETMSEQQTRSVRLLALRLGKNAAFEEIRAL